MGTPRCPGRRQPSPPGWDRWRGHPMPQRCAPPPLVPRDSGRISGNHRRPRRYDRRLLRVFYLSAQLSVRSSARVQDLLRPQTRGRETAHPSSTCSGQAEIERSVGDVARRGRLSICVHRRDGCLTRNLHGPRRSEVPLACRRSRFNRITVSAHRGCCFPRFVSAGFVL